MASDWLINSLQGDRFSKLFTKSGAFRNVVDQYVTHTVSSRRPNISVDIDPKTNKPLYRINKGNVSVYKSTLDEAIAEADNPLRTINRYTGKLSSGMQPVTGSQYNAFLESMADKLGGTIVHESYNTSRPKLYQYVLDSVGYQKGVDGAASTARGIVSSNGDVTHVLKFFKHGADTSKLDQAMEVSEFLKELEQKGLTLDFSKPGIFKRINTLISHRAFSIFEDASTPMKIGYYDPLKLGLTKDVKLGRMPDFESFAGRVKGLVERNPAMYGATQAGEAGVQEALGNIYKTAFDGQMIMPKSGLNTFIKEIDSRVQHYTELIRRAEAGGATSSSELKELRGALAGSLKAREELLKVQEQGGSANARWIFGDMIKGDVNIVDDEFYQRFASKMGYDTSSAEAIGNLPSVLAQLGDRKDELRLTQGGFATLDMRKKAEQLYAGITESGVFPGIFTDELLDSSFGEEQSMLLQDLRTSGSKSGALRDMINKVLVEDPINYVGSPAELEQFVQLQAYARRMKDMLDYGIAPGSIDSIGNQFVAMYKNHLMRLRRGGHTTQGTPDLAFMTRIKNGFFAEISPLEVAEPQKKRGGLGLMMDTLSYDRKAGRFNMNALDTYRLHRTHGGFDNDDTFRPVLMYDTRAKRLMAFNSRQPFEMGEYAWMGVDLSTMPGIDPQVKRLYFERIKLLGTRRMTDNDVKRINEIGASIDAILRKQYHNVDVASLYEGGREFMAPKSFAITQETIGRYLKGNVATSFHAIDSGGDPMNVRKAFQQLHARTRQGIYTDSLMEFRGHSYNQFDSRYFTSVVKDDQEVARLVAAGADPSRVKSMEGYMAGRGKTLDAVNPYAGLTHSSDIQAMRLELEDAVKGSLGRYVNLRTAIENMIEVQVRGKGITDLNLPSIDRERIIDAVVKEGDMRVIQTTDEITNDMVETLVKWLAEHRNSGIKLDPYLFDTRLKDSFGGKFESELKKYDLTTKDILLDENDPAAIISRRVAKRIEQVKEMERRAAEVMNEDDLSIGKSLMDFDASAEELDRAERFMNSYTRSVRELGDEDDIGDQMQRMFEELGDGEPSAFLSKDEELNRRSVQFLREEGLFDELGQDTIRSTNAVERQMLATAKYIELNKETLKSTLGSRGIYSALTSMSSNDGLGVGNLFFTAYNRRKHAGLIQRYNRNVSLLRDTAQYRNALKDDKAYQGILKKTSDQAKKLGSLFPEMASIGELDPHELPFFGAVQSAVKAPPGYLTRETRAAADEVSKEVTKVTMKRFDKEVFQKMMGTIQGMRAGVFGLGIFAAVGLAYGATRGRTPEQLQGPPLLPGGSAYEDYSENQDFSSMYSAAGMGRGNFNPGTLYQVNATGSVDPTELQNRIQSILGGGNMSSTFYEARPTIRSGKRNSQSILEERNTF